MQYHLNRDKTRSKFVKYRDIILLVCIFIVVLTVLFTKRGNFLNTGGEEILQAVLFGLAMLSFIFLYVCLVWIVMTSMPSFLLKVKQIEHISISSKRFRYLGIAFILSVILLLVCSSFVKITIELLAGLYVFIPVATIFIGYLLGLLWKRN